MARKEQLRQDHEGMILNLTSKHQESSLGKAMGALIDDIRAKFGVTIHHDKDWKLADIVHRLKPEFPDVEFATPLPKSAMRPDGGILSIVDVETQSRHPIAVVEVKNQGTNDLRVAEGLGRQAQGNAIERLGKNVIGFRAAMLAEGIMPFVCFGYGCDFAEGSSILDRVVTIAMFGPLNRISVVPEGEGGLFNRGSYFFREAEWSAEEMHDVLLEVATRSIHYYFAKYGEEHFRR